VNLGCLRCLKLFAQSLCDWLFRTIDVKIDGNEIKNVKNVVFKKKFKKDKKPIKNGNGK
jgi:hypothetical protein